MYGYALIHMVVWLWLGVALWLWLVVCMWPGPVCGWLVLCLLIGVVVWDADRPSLSPTVAGTENIGSANCQQTRRPALGRKIILFRPLPPLLV